MWISRFFAANSLIVIIMITVFTICASLNQLPLFVAQQLLPLLHGRSSPVHLLRA
jgi:hypothetical protein